MTKSSSNVFTADYEDFKQKVLQPSQQGPVLVDFWADWCAPCHAIAPHLARVIDEFDGKVPLCKVEVDEGENMKLAGHYRMRGFPTIMLFYQGEEVARFSGSKPSHWIREWLDEHVGEAIA